jgi:hypothetical protein
MAPGWMVAEKINQTFTDIDLCLPSIKGMGIISNFQNGFVVPLGLAVLSGIFVYEAQK